MLGYGVGSIVVGLAALSVVVGSLLGALTEMGVPEEDARYYETEFRSGRTLVTVRATGRANEALNILRRHGAYDATTRSAGTVR